MRTHQLALFPLILLLAITAGCQSAPEPERTGFFASSLADQTALEEQLLTMHTPDTYRHHLQQLTQHPTIAGMESNRYVIDYIAGVMDGAGLAVREYDYDVLLAQPGSVQVVLEEPVQMVLPTIEAEYEADPYSSHPDLLHGWSAYSGSGRATADVVYANYGTREDFAQLREMGVETEGKVILARFGGNFRGFKAKYAEEAGAVGLVMFTDPTPNRETYPQGIFPNETTIQRGSLLTLDYYGDPLTPFEPALPLDHPDTPDRLPVEEVDFHTIPVAPIGHGAAREILSRMNGDVAPDAWQGGFDFDYRLTGADVQVTVEVDQPYDIKRITNVIGMIEGSEYPNEWIILGSHLDAWSFGAADPNSGTAMLLTLAESLAELAGHGHRPRRSILFGHWDAEEYMLIGSSEWVEHLRDELDANAVLYLNADMSVTGPNFRASSAPSLKKPIAEAAKTVRHPDTGATIYEMWTERSEDGRPPIGNLGGGSDHVGFYMHAGIPSAGVAISGSVPVYHSNYDTFWFYETHLDPDFHYGPTLADVYGVLALRFANADLLPFDLTSYGRDLQQHLAQIESLAGTPLFERSRLPVLIEEIAERTQEADRRLAVAAAEETLQRFALRQVNQSLIQLERSFLHDEGLPFSAWLQSLYASSDPYSGYASWMLPAYRYAIAEERLEDEAFIASLHRAHEAAMERFLERLEGILEMLEE
ncbi:MAG: M28 family peptidase [Balneolaceae bacterium]